MEILIVFLLLLIACAQLYYYNVLTREVTELKQKLNLFVKRYSYDDVEIVDEEIQGPF